MGTRGLAIWVLLLGAPAAGCGGVESGGDVGRDDATPACPDYDHRGGACTSPGQVCDYPDELGCGPDRCTCTDGFFVCVGGGCDGGEEVEDGGSSEVVSDVVPDLGPEVALDVPPPACDSVAGSGFSLAFRPAAPWVGGATRVSVTGPDGLTNVAVEASGPGASPAPTWIGVDGSGPFTWSWSIVFPAAGAWCVTFRADPDGTVYQRALVTVAPDAPPAAPFKVVSNHQWTCEEEYTFAINVDTVVLDETGAPLPGVRVLVEHAPCETAADHPPPTEVTTGDDGTVRWENYNPRCFFHERVADGPSDTAIEIYTGIWEEQDAAGGGTCNYCSTYAENVWGHWSYTITFQRVPGAVELCEGPTDHAGQAACSPLLHWEEPAAACTPL